MKWRASVSTIFQPTDAAIQATTNPVERAHQPGVRIYGVASLSRSPCDDGAILAGPSYRPGAGSGSWVLAAAILGSSMAFIDGTVVNVALPAIQTSLHATLRDVQWVVESYGLLLAALLLTGGALGDIYGRRKVFAIGVALF